MKLDLCLVPPTQKISSKWIKDLSVNTETIKLSKENMGKSLFTLDLAMVS